MASLIRLKQIESGSALTTAAETGTNFSSSVISIITNEIVGVLPDGVISSSAQIVLGDTSGQLSGSRVIGDIAATSVNYEDIIGLPTLVSASQQISFDGVSNKPTLVSSSIQISFDGISDKPSIVSGSEQIVGILQPLNQFTSSLDNTFATDAELAVTTSNLSVDMGEF